MQNWTFGGHSEVGGLEREEWGRAGDYSRTNIFLLVAIWCIINKSVFNFNYQILFEDRIMLKISLVSI